MFRQGFIPLFLINKIRSPGIHLLLGIILDIDLVNSISENDSYHFQVFPLIPSYFHCALKFEMENRERSAVTITPVAPHYTETTRLIKS